MDESKLRSKKKNRRNGLSITEMFIW